VKRLLSSWRAAVALAALVTCKHAPQRRYTDVPRPETLLADVRWLSDLERRGRAAGSPEERETAGWLANRFAELGLTPAGDRGTWFQNVPIRGDVASQNVMAWLPGTDSRARWILVGAHVDHLGVHDGKVYPGADDNASGIAGMLGVATAMNDSDRPRASILFVGFGAEEQGLVGSRWLAAHPPKPLETCAAVINIDMIGRSPFLGAEGYALPKALVGIAPGPAVGVLDDSRGSVVLDAARVGCAQAEIKMHAAEDFPLLEQPIRDEAKDRSDDAPFSEAGVPTLLFSTSLQDDYHQSTDAIEKIDSITLHKITRAIRFTAERLAR
jgi:Zn-dependent M28 family amino/carboxypeptidase